MIPPSPRYPGSGGDEAIILSAADCFNQQENVRVELAVYNTHDPGWFFARQKNLRLIPVGHLNKRDFKKYCRVILFGTDVVDGSFGVEGAMTRYQWLRTALEANVMVKLTNFSFREKVDRAILDQIRDLHAAGLHYSLRDRVSQERFYAATGLWADFAADTAFLLEPAAAPSGLANWILAHKQEARSVIGVNPHGFDPELLAKLIHTQKNTAFVFIPHDRRKTHDELGQVERVMRLLNINSARVRSAGFLGAREIRGLCALLDVVITGRMHLAIAAFSQGVLPIGLEYNGKFIGLYRLFNLEDFVVKAENGVETIQPIFEKAMMMRDSARRKITEHLAEIQTSSRRNMLIG